MFVLNVDNILIPPHSTFVTALCRTKTAKRYFFVPGAQPLQLMLQHGLVKSFWKVSSCWQFFVKGVYGNTAGLT